MTLALTSVAAKLVASTPSPTVPPNSPDPASVTPGFLGFLVVFLLAIATWLLLRNMTARLRRMRYREERRVAGESELRSPGDVPDAGAPGRR